MEPREVSKNINPFIIVKKIILFILGPANNKLCGDEGHVVDFQTREKFEAVVKIMQAHADPNGEYW